jgi:ribonuclease T2
MRSIIGAAWIGLLLPLGSAQAQVPLDGIVVARQDCPATPAIRSDANPGAVTLTVARSYRLIGENRANGTHYLVEVPEAEPSRRWIPKSCAERAASAGIGTASAGEGGEPTAADEGASGRAHPELAIAISWQPAFCETRPSRRECARQAGESRDATHFSLHGLWPQPRGLDYCGISAEAVDKDRAGRWTDLPPLALSPQTHAALDEAMPGVRSGLERHEWVKHGTCYGTDPEEYYADSLLVLAAVNASPVRALFAERIGQQVTRDEIGAAFDSAFGASTGERVRLSCADDGGRRIIVELVVGLSGEISPDAEIGALIAKAPAAEGGCAGGVVDAAGLQ